jgi:hypothetical protein
MKILYVCSPAFGEIIPFLVISKVAVTFDVCSDKSTRYNIENNLFIELHVASQLREGTQFSRKGKIRSSSIGQFD